MKAQFDNQLISSFALWFDHYLLKDGEAFTNVSGSNAVFYDTTNTWSISGYNLYSAPFKQFVYDSSIPGAIIITGVTVKDTSNVSTAYSINSSNLLGINYAEGQAFIKDTALTNVSSVSGNYAKKEFAVKITDEPDEKLLFETKYATKLKYPRSTTTGVLENEEPFPIIYIKRNGSYNEPAAFGGQDFTTMDIRAIVLADNQFNLDAVCSLFRDKSRYNFYLFENNEYPFNYIGSLKSGNLFNYDTLVAGKRVGGGQGASIKDVRISRFGNQSNKYDALTANIYSAAIDFQIIKMRVPF